TVRRPHTPMTDNVRKISGTPGRQRQCPKLCFVPPKGVIRRQELRMIGRNVKQGCVSKWSWNDRGIATCDGCLNQELLRTDALRDIQPGTVGQKVGLRNSVMGDLGRAEHFRRRKRPT